MKPSAAIVLVIVSITVSFFLFPALATFAWYMTTRGPIGRFLGKANAELTSRFSVPGSDRTMSDVVDTENPNHRLEPERLPRVFICGVERNGSRHHPEAAMRNDSGYCRRQADECAVRAQEASDKEIQAFFVRMRGVWIAVADRFDVANPQDRQKTAQRETTRLR
jgi:hypothetical protein